MTIDKFVTDSLKQLLETGQARYRFLCGNNAPFDAENFLMSLDDQLGSMKLPEITHIELFLTSQCNLACDYCFVEGKENRCERMDWPTARRSIDWLLEVCGEKKELGILFFGGEPMLEFDLMMKIVEYANGRVKEADKKISYTMTTNGVLFDEERARALADNGITYMVSLDGAREDHDRHRKTRSGEGSFDAVMKNLETMRKYHPRMSVRVTPYPDTVDRLFENVKHLIALGFDDFIIGLAHGNIPHWNHEHLGVYRDQVIRLFKWFTSDGFPEEYRRRGININLFNDIRRKYGSFLGAAALGGTSKKEDPEKEVIGEGDQESEKGESPKGNGSAKPAGNGFYCGVVDDTYRAFSSFGCRAGMGYMCISPTGTLFPCSLLLGREGQEGIYPIGDIHDGIDRHKRKEFLLLNSNRQEDCLGCESYFFCSGGCPGNNYDSTGCITRVKKSQCEHQKLDLILAKTINLLYRLRRA
jgi:radical SAM protein with 4Fe4S-binding SPASM domain